MEKTWKVLEGNIWEGPSRENSEGNCGGSFKGSFWSISEKKIIEKFLKQSMDDFLRLNRFLKKIHRRIFEMNHWWTFKDILGGMADKVYAKYSEGILGENYTGISK